MPNNFYMLDTNTVSNIIKGKSKYLKEKLLSVPMENISISVITEAELLHGLAKLPKAKTLRKLVNEFLQRVEIMEWTSEVAATYGNFRAACEQEGKNLGTMDMLIAAHAVSLNATLVTSDKAFFKIKKIEKIEDWWK